MRRYFFVMAFAVLFNTKAVTAQPAPEEQYRVTFDGIIMHNLTEIAKARALIVRGSDDMPHDATLVTPPDIDINTMRLAIGKQLAKCTTQDCRFHVDNVAMRIGTADANTPAPGPVSVDSTFRQFTPHMSCVTKGKLYPIVNDELPSGPIAAVFELVGGTLSACTFPGHGFFSPDYDQHSGRKFTDKVTLDGVVPSGQIATLQVRSYLTKGKWLVVPRVGTARTRLLLRVENHAPPVSGQVPASNLHFAINGQLIETSLPFPSICPVAGKGDDPNCPAQPYYPNPRPPASGGTEACLPPPIAVDDDKYDCPPVVTMSGLQMPMMRPNAIPSAMHAITTTAAPLMQKGGTFDLIVGCANSQWP